MQCKFQRQKKRQKLIHQKKYAVFEKPTEEKTKLNVYLVRYFVDAYSLSLLHTLTRTSRKTKPIWTGNYANASNRIFILIFFNLFYFILISAGIISLCHGSVLFERSSVILLRCSNVHTVCFGFFFIRAFVSFLFVCVMFTHFTHKKS